MYFQGKTKQWGKGGAGLHSLRMFVVTNKVRPLEMEEPILKQREDFKPEISSTVLVLLSLPLKSKGTKGTNIYNIHAALN